MRIALLIAGALCALMGFVWLLQGINVLPGSFMSGQMKWAVIGVLMLALGAGLILAARRRA